MIRKGQLLVLMCWMGLVATGMAQHQPPKEKGRNCGTMYDYRKRIEQEPKFRKQELRLNKVIDQYILNQKKLGADALRTGIIKIPVVVHVVYKNETENISDAQVQSQIDALNRDYRMANADVSTVPAAFASLTADMKIEFELAKRDPDCSPTNGITRTMTSESDFTLCPSCATPESRNPVKFNSSGGKDAWPTDQYLNLWVADLVYGGFELLGYGSFPSEFATRPNEDGVVIDYQYFGTIGTVSAPLNLGRTAVHELGHWLNLRHIWGDDQFDADDCLLSDFVDDTPNQGDENYGCPSFPEVSCSNGPNGDMFMNYMDYVDDNCMVMFTQGQVDRMAATFFTTHASLIGSPGLISPTGVTVAADLWSQDNHDDIGEEPNTAGGSMYRSEDIWVRNQDDGLVNHEHQKPIYRPSEPNYVYVRVRNRGCSDPQSGDVRLYWAKASSGLSWPSPWDGSVGAPALMGSPLGVEPVTVNAGEYEVLKYEWYPPNPDDYASFGADKSHFCLLSRIETDPVSPYGMAFPETTNLWENVNNNNNIVWKNVTVLPEDTGGGRFASLMVGNYSRKEEMKVMLTFNTPKGKFIPNIFEWGKVYVRLDQKLYNNWKKGGKKGRYIKEHRGGMIAILNPGAYLSNLYFEPQEVNVMQLIFKGNQEPKFNAVYELNVEQVDLQTKKTMGGETFFIKELARNQNEKGREIKSPIYDNLQRKKEGNSKIGFFPNPAQGLLTIYTGSVQFEHAEMTILDTSGKVKMARQFSSAGANQHQIDVSGLPTGIYVVQIKTEKTVYKHKLIVK